MKNRIIAVRSGKELSVIVNGNTFYVKNDELEDTIALYKEVLERKKSGKDEDVEYLMEILSPEYKLEAAGGVLQKDRKGNYFLAGFNRTLPRKLLEMLLENIENDLPLEGLVNFWKLLMLNPDEHVKNDLFQFADRFRMPITDNGYFIAYKSVAWKGAENKDLGVFISKKYVELKAAGRSVEDKRVVSLSKGNGSLALMTEEEISEYIEDYVENNMTAKRQRMAEEWIIEKNETKWNLVKDTVSYKDTETYAREMFQYVVPEDHEVRERIIDDMEFVNHGPLEGCFKNLGTMFDYEVPTFTDWHTKNSTIVLGEPVSIPREECDNDPMNTCSSGLHVGAPGYVSGFGGRSTDNYILACLVNPMNVVAVPVDYSYEKMRTCEYLPYAICEMDGGVIKELDTNYFEEDYINYEKEALESELGTLNLENEAEIEKEKLIKDRLVVLS